MLTNYFLQAYDKAAQEWLASLETVERKENIMSAKDIKVTISKEVSLSEVIDEMIDDYEEQRFSTHALKGTFGQTTTISFGTENQRVMGKIEALQELKSKLGLEK